MKHITTKEELDKQRQKGPVFVDFHAKWCGPCQLLGKKLPELQEKYPHVIFVKVNVDDADEDLVEEYGVSSIPHVVLSKDAKNYTSVVGLDWEKIVTKMKTLKQ